MQSYRLRRKRYKRQRKNAKGRGIPWLFNYVAWWKMWCKSGKYEQRGNYKGKFCMARFRDKGPYAPHNVRIIRVEENHSEKKMSPEAIAKTAAFWRGRKHSEETKARMRAAWKIRKQKVINETWGTPCKV